MCTRVFAPSDQHPRALGRRARFERGEAPVPAAKEKPAGVAAKAAPNGLGVVTAGPKPNPPKPPPVPVTGASPISIWKGWSGLPTTKTSRTKAYGAGPNMCHEIPSHIITAKPFIFPTWSYSIKC
eukprot:631398-Prorocentrum_minimum.AAC.7